VNTVCQILQIPRSTYYRAKTEPAVAEKTESEQDRELLEHIKEIKLRFPAWGYRRVRALLKKRLKTPLNRKRIYRLMKRFSLLVDVKRYKAKRTPQTTKPKATRKNEWWGTDMTKFYVNTVGWVYLVVVLDWYSRKIVGFSFGRVPNTSLWLQALHMAVQNECPLGARTYGLNLMSDNGSQPTSGKYEKELETLGFNHVTTSYNNPKGNAETERVIRTLKEDAIWPYEFDIITEAIEVVTKQITFYNKEYPHSALGELSPIEFDQITSLQKPITQAA
jgi:transposase InsO family protein